MVCQPVLCHCDKILERDQLKRKNDGLFAFGSSPGSLDVTIVLESVERQGTIARASLEHK